MYEIRYWDGMDVAVFKDGFSTRKKAEEYARPLAAAGTICWVEVC